MNTSLQQLRTKTEDENQSLKSAIFLTNILKNGWLIAIVSFIVAMIGVVYALTVTPIYEANILIQVKRNPSLSGEFQADIPAATEVEILRSRSIISRAVDALQLDINAEPKRFPILGAVIAGRNKDISNPGLFGFGGYVWGGEQASISKFNLPEALLGRVFILTVAGKNEFVFTQKDSEISIRGKVAENVKIRTKYGEIEILVAQIQAKPGARFSVSRSPRFQVVEQLRKSLAVSENGKQSHVIGVSLKGSKPLLISQILNEVGNEYVRQHVAQKTEDAEKAISFHNRQLDEAKEKLQRSDDRVAQVRRSRGIFDVSEEARTLSQQSVALRAQLAESKQKKDELLSRFLEQHPAVVLINKHIQELNRDLINIETKSRELAATEYELTNITRDKQVNSDINTELLNTRHKLDKFAPANSITVRLVDRAETPVQSVTMTPPTMIAVACLAGFLLGVIASFLKNTFLGGLNGPREIERLLGLMVSAAIPHCENRIITHKNGLGKKNDVLVLPEPTPSEDAIESLRILRSTVQFLMRDSDRNTIMFTGPTPEVGKSFICANFAMVLAAAGKNVLLIDCDLRRGSLHRYFDLKRANGLADMLVMLEGDESFIHRNVENNVDFISTGNLPTHPAELLSNPNFGILLQTLSTRYDYVLIDTAPVLNFSDALVVGVHAKLIFNVVRDGVSSMNDTEEAVRRLNRAGLAVTGIILNDVNSQTNRYGYGTPNVPTKASHGDQTSEDEIGRIYTGKA